jgi:hypothetical protein
MPKPASYQPTFTSEGKLIQTYSMWRDYSPEELAIHEAKRVAEETPKLKRVKAIRKLGIREVAARHYQEPDNSQEKDKSHYQPTGKFGPPKVLGMRRFLQIPDELKLSQLDHDE